MKVLKLRKPTLDVPTRWNSTFVMLTRFQDFKELCLKHFKNTISEAEWEKIDILVSSLKPLYETTLKLQHQQLLMGDFYRLWFTLKVELQNRNTDESLAIYDCICKREPLLINTDLMNSAVFLDPRFRRILNLEQKEAAKTHLKKLAARIISVKQVGKC